MAEPAIPNPCATVPETRPRTLLIVDDEANILSSLKRLLRRDGYRILAASSGQEALDILARESVDVIMSDQRMPQMTGVEFLRIAKERTPDTMRLVLSGYTDIQSITDAINEGAIYKFLTKPWDDDNLRANIEEAFRHKNMCDENRRLQEAVRKANIELADAVAQLQQVVADKQERISIDETSLEVVQEIFQHLPWPVLGIDEHGQVSVANEAALLFFARRQPFVGCFLADLLPPEWHLAVTGSEEGDQIVRDESHCYRLNWRQMGMTSRSRGLLLVICRCGNDHCPSDAVTSEWGLQ